MSGSAPPLPEPPGGAAATATGLHARGGLPPGTVLAGRFRIEAMIGLGGMGVVYRANDQTLGVPVALKLLRPELAGRDDAVGRLRDELLMARQVSSPHVVRIHDIVRHDDQWLISMDLVDGESLARRLEREGRLPVEQALDIALQVAKGIGAAHARGVIHRDLKPANILLDAQGNAYITDFGVARSRSSGATTHTGDVVGTPDYLSPEQVRGDPVDGRSDLYALGLMLHEMLTGQPAFTGDTVTEVLAQRLVRRPTPAARLRPEVPAWVGRLLERLLQTRPAQRFPDAAAVVQALEQRGVARRRPSRRRLAGAAGLMLLAVALVAGGAWWWQRATEPVPAAVAGPLDRLLVLPLETGGETATDPLLVALDAHLRHAIATASSAAVVDPARAWQALRQLDPTGHAPPDLQALHRVGVVERILRPDLQAGDDGLRLHATLHAVGRAPSISSGPPAGDASAALQAWAGLPAGPLAGVAAAPLDLMLPDPPEALAAFGEGLLAYRAGALDAAGAHFRDATARAPGYTLAWLALADTALAMGEQDLAAHATERALASAAAGSVLEQELQARQALLEGEATRAVGYWRTRLQARPDDTLAALELARAQGAGGDFSAAVATLRQLVTRDDGDPRAWFELGKFAILSGDARPAVDDYLVRALVQSKRSGNVFVEAEAVNALGVGYGRLGQTADAIEQYRKAVDLRDRIGNRRGVATSLRNLANLHALTGDFAQAADHLDRARAIHAGLGDRAGLAAVENELGLLLEERGDYPAALLAFQRSLRAWRDAGDPHGVAQALNDIGFANYQLGDYDDAQVYWQQAATAHEGLGNQTGVIRTAQNLGLLDMARGRWSRARQRLEQSLAEALRHQMVEESAVSHRNLAELELVQGHLGAALEQADAAAAMFAHRDDQRGQVDAGLLAAQALAAAADPAGAQARLAALAPALESASVEQQAIAHLLRARLPPTPATPAPDASFAAAATLAAESGVRALQLQIDLQRAHADGNLPAGLDAATASLGNAALRLGWLELAMRDALERDRPDLALDAYREAARLLRNGDFLAAATLHQLGARAHSANGDAAGAALAQRHADEATTTRGRLLPAGADGSPSQTDVP